MHRTVNRYLPLHGERRLRRGVPSTYHCLRTPHSNLCRQSPATVYEAFVIHTSFSLDRGTFHKIAHQVFQHTAVADNADCGIGAFSAAIFSTVSVILSYTSVMVSPPGAFIISGDESSRNTPAYNLFQYSPRFGFPSRPQKISLSPDFLLPQFPRPFAWARAVL